MWPLLSRKDVREYLKISDKQIQHLVERNLLTKLTLPGGRARYYKSEVERFGEAFKDIWHEQPPED